MYEMAGKRITYARDNRLANDRRVYRMKKKFVRIFSLSTRTYVTYVCSDKEIMGAMNAVRPRVNGGGSRKLFLPLRYRGRFFTGMNVPL